MSTLCKYCNDAENKQDRPGLICELCVCFVHLTCLRRPGTPGDFACDVFFEFTCADCSPNKKEMFVRNKFPWVNVLLLTLHHLKIHSYGISNHGYFHYKTHICSFIDRSWNVLFGTQTKQKKNWVGTIAGMLSVYNNLFFMSGSVALGETGWWKLLHKFSPAVGAHIVQELARDKSKPRQRNQVSLTEKLYFVMKITELGYADLINRQENEPRAASPEAAPTKKRRLDSDELSGVSSSSLHENSDRLEGADEISSFDDPLDILCSKNITYPDVDVGFGDLDFPEQMELTRSTSPTPQSTEQIRYEYYDSESRSTSPLYQNNETQSDDNDTKRPDTKTKKVVPEKPENRENLFSTQLNSVDMPWVEKIPEESKDLIHMSQYEEIQLLKQVENLIPKVKDPGKKAHLYRLRAKLTLRRLKKHKHLPIFDVDKTVKLLGGYVTEDPRVVMNTERVLDRFQRSYLIDNLSGTIASTNYGTLVLSGIEASPFRSAYSGTLLRPYIRRDNQTNPTWLQLTDELLKRTNRHIKDYTVPPRATIDYSYVRPHHIAAVNNLCAQFFWPGIDLTESLQYPEFSCVVTYKRLVIACAFLVPDAGHNEAYISFILTRPEWRKAKIASFMLYHLLQTCTGKDVTLHVSPTNPAIFLYQKFGFKVEELIQDFYEKYYDIDYKGCRHALFLRLVR